MPTKTNLQPKTLMLWIHAAACDVMAKKAAGVVMMIVVSLVGVMAGVAPNSHDYHVDRYGEGNSSWSVGTVAAAAAARAVAVSSSAA